MTEFRPRRSVLYMPGTNIRAMDKVKTLPVDCVIMDLEDSVAPDVKNAARQQIHKAIGGGGYAYREIIVRINDSGSEWFAEDVKMAVTSGADGLLVPKVNNPADVLGVSELISSYLSPGQSQQFTSGNQQEKIQIWVMMETPEAMLNAAEIAKLARDGEPRLSCFVMGTNDLAKETGAALSPDRLPMLYWLSSCMTAARAYGLTILDGVYNDFADDAGFRRECVQGKSLGMDGKTLIHPRQIEICNDVYSPRPDEVLWSRKIIAAFEEPENQGKGVISLEGKMIELLHRDIARQIVAVADAIESRETSK